MTIYEKYKLQWLIDHNYSINDLIQELEDYINLHVLKAFKDWEFDTGFNSEIYVCEEEYYDAEVQNEL